MPRITILVCGNDRCGPPGASAALCDVAREAVAAERLAVEVHQVKCLDLCQRGPHVVIHGARGTVPGEARAPDGGVAYDEMTPERMRRVVTGHLARGEPVVEALHRDLPGRSTRPERG